MKMLIVICDRPFVNKIINVLNSVDINYHISLYAKGTANSEILSYFGLESSEKEVILSFVEKEQITIIMEKLSDNEYIKSHGAVAFSIPMDGITKNTLEFIKQLEDKNGKS